MERAAREAKGTFLLQVDPKGKEIINRWEKEINTTQGKILNKNNSRIIWAKGPRGYTT
jgi:hypothetical protein